MNDLIELAETQPAAFIEKVIDAAEVSISDLCNGYSRTSDVELDGYYVSWTIVHSEGGHEGEGESVDRVLQFRIGRSFVIYLRTGGSYESYNGTEWSNEWEVVYPREVTVIQYFSEP